MKKIVIGWVATFVATGAIADVAVGFRETSGTNVVSGWVTVEEKLLLSPEGTYMKTGAGTLEVPQDKIELRTGWSMDVLNGKLKLTGKATDSGAAVPSVVQDQAALWLDATALPEGDFPIWNDSRAGAAFSAVAAFTNASAGATNPVVTTKDGFKSVYFGGKSGKYMRIYKGATKSNLDPVYHYFVVYGGYDYWTSLLGDVVNSRGYGLLTGIDTSGCTIAMDTANSLLYPRGDLCSAAFDALFLLNGRYVDALGERPHRGFALYEGMTVASRPQIFNAIAHNYFETQTAANLKPGGDYFSEIIVFTNQISESARLSVESYLMAKWNLPQNRQKITIATGDYGSRRTPNGTGRIRTVAGATTEVEIAAGEESLPLAFDGAGAVVKKGAGTLVIGPGVERTPAGSFALEAGDVLLRGGRMPAVEPAGGETWNAAQYPTTRVQTTAADNASGIKVSKATGGDADIVRKTGTGNLTVNGFANGVKRVMVEAGTLHLAAKENAKSADLDAGVGEAAVYIPNHSFETPFTVKDNNRNYYYGSTVNEWYGNSFQYVTFFPKVATWSDYLTPFGTNAMMLVADGFARTSVTLPSAGTYELSCWATSRYGSRNIDPYRCRRGRIDISFDGIHVGHLQTDSNPFACYRFRFTVPAASAGLAKYLLFDDLHSLTDDCTIIDNVRIVRVPESPRLDVVKVPGGDFEAGDYKNGDVVLEGMENFFSRNMSHTNWTLSVTAETDPGRLNGTNGYIAICTPATPAYQNVGGHYTTPFFSSHDGAVGTGVLGFFAQYGRAESKQFFTLPAGKWVLRADLAFWPLNVAAGKGTEVGATGVPTVQAWLVKEDSSEISLGTVAVSVHNLTRMVWPTTVEFAADTQVKLRIGNIAAAGSGMLDNLEFVPSAVGGEEMNLVKDTGFESALWTVYTYDNSFADNLTNGRFPYLTDSWAFGLNVYDGDYCTRLHNGGGILQTVTFPSPGLYRFTVHAHPRSDETRATCNRFGAELRREDGTFVSEIVRTITFPPSSHFQSYAALFEVTDGQLAAAGGKLQLRLHAFGVVDSPSNTNAAGKVNANYSTMLDGVEVVKVEPARLTMPTIPEDQRITVREGAALNLDYPGTITVQMLRLGETVVPNGSYSAADYPDYLTGMGKIEVVSNGTLLYIR